MWDTDIYYMYKKENKAVTCMVFQICVLFEIILFSTTGAAAAVFWEHKPTQC